MVIYKHGIWQWVLQIIGTGELSIIKDKYNNIYAYGTYIENIKQLDLNR